MHNLDKILDEAISLNVSDIHFCPTKNSVELYYRIGGKMVYQLKIDVEHYLKVCRYLKFKSKIDMSIVNDIQDGSFEYHYNEQIIFCRISTLPLYYNESICIRLIYEQNLNEYESHVFNKQEISKIINALEFESGVFIFTGPTGSGKTTTMYYILSQLVKRFKKKVITIENPVEIINDKFYQIQINEAINLDYSKGLKASLRHDPDIIMIGEIRDETTARNVFRAGLTGHTVICTMHTKDKYGVIERFLDFGFHHSEIKSVLIGISNQRLLKLDGEITSVLSVCVAEELKKMMELKSEINPIQEILQNTIH